MRLQVKGKNVEVSAVDPDLRRDEAREARPTARRPDAGRARARGGEEPVDPGEPCRRGDDLHEGPDAAGARGVPRHAGVDRPARREARAAGQALPREAPRGAAAARARERRRPEPGIRSAGEDGEPWIVKTKQFADQADDAPRRPCSSSSSSATTSSSSATPTSSEVNVVYRRRDGGYGLIEPTQ